MSNEEISAAIGKIMENPEFAGLVRELRGDSGNKDNAEVSKEMMSHLPDVMSMLGPILGGRTTEESTNEKKAQPDQKEESKQTSDHQEKRYDKAKAEKLMVAIKPYLKPGRCEIIDKCMSAMQLTDAIDIIKGLEGLSKPKT